MGAGGCDSPRPPDKRLGSTLTAIHGIGVVNAMDLLTEIGDPCRFTSEGQFARWCGAAPIAVSSGEGDGPPRRHRLDLGGNRAVNSILHTVHVTQVRCHPPAKVYMARQAERHKPMRAACRSHKRHLANVIIRHMWTDANRPPRPRKRRRGRLLDKRASSQRSPP